MSEHSIAYGSFTIERFYPAKPQKVFRAHSDAAIKRRWFAEGEGWDIETYELDFRVGGREFGSFKFRDGQDIHNNTQFFDIVDNARIIFAYSMGFGEKPFSVSLSTVELKPDGKGTRLVFTEQAAFLEGADGADIRRAGWEQLLGKLESEVKRET